MAEVEGEDGLPEVPPKRRKRGLYKLYKYDIKKKFQGKPFMDGKRNRVKKKVTKKIAK